jgi:MFS family permease
LKLETLRAIPAGIWTLGFVSLLMDVSSELIHALLPVYLVTGLGASVVAVGLIEGVSEATASIVKLFAGVVSDWIQRRKLLAGAGYALSALSKLIFPLAQSIGWIVAARVIDRTGKGIRGAPRDALVADLSPPTLRGASFGLRQALDTIGAVLGPVAALILMAATGGQFRTVFWFALVPAVLCVVLLIVGVREPARAAAAVRRGFPLQVRELSRLGAGYWSIILVACAFTLARFSEAFLILRGQGAGLGPALAPIVFIVMNFVYALAAYPVGALSDRLGRVPMLGIGLMLLIAADLVLAAAPFGIVGILMGTALWGLHLGFTQGLLSALVADEAPAELCGTAFGVFNLVMGLVLLAASALAGVLWAAHGAGATFMTGALIAALALAGLVAVRHQIGARA